MKTLLSILNESEGSSSLEGSVMSDQVQMPWRGNETGCFSDQFIPSSLLIGSSDGATSPHVFSKGLASSVISPVDDSPAGDKPFLHAFCRLDCLCRALCHQLGGICCCRVEPVVSKDRAPIQLPNKSPEERRTQSQAHQLAISMASLLAPVP